MNVTDTAPHLRPFGAVRGPFRTAGCRSQRAQDEAKTVSVCDTQPVTAEGIRTLLNDIPGLQFRSGHRFAGSRQGYFAGLRALGAHAGQGLRDPDCARMAGGDTRSGTGGFDGEHGHRDLGSFHHRGRGAALPASGSARNSAQDRRDSRDSGVFAHGGRRAQLDGRIGIWRTRDAASAIRAAS